MEQGPAAEVGSLSEVWGEVNSVWVSAGEAHCTKFRSLNIDSNLMKEKTELECLYFPWRIEGSQTERKIYLSNKASKPWIPG